MSLIIGYIVIIFILKGKEEYLSLCPSFPLKKDENKKQIKEKVIRNAWDMGQNS